MFLLGPIRCELFASTCVEGLTHHAGPPFPPAVPAHCDGWAARARARWGLLDHWPWRPSPNGLVVDYA